MDPQISTTNKQGLISSGIGILGNLFSGIWNNWQSNKAYQRQLGLYQKQVEDNRENWRMNNEYNSPSNQVARLKSAGINPASQYGNGSLVGNSSSSSDGGSPSSVPNALNSFDSFGQVGNLYNQGMLIGAQIENLESQARLNRTKADDLEETRQTRIDNIESRTDLNTKQARYVDSQNQQLIANLDIIHRTYEQKLINAKDEHSKNLLALAEMSENIDLIAEQIKKVAADTRLSQAQRQKVLTEVTLNNLQASQVIPTQMQLWNAEIDKDYSQAAAANAERAYKQIMTVLETKRFDLETKEYVQNWFKMIFGLVPSVALPIK